MAINNQTNTIMLIRILWISLLCSPVFLWLSLVLMDKFSVVQTINLKYAELFFYTGLLFIPVSIYFLKSFRKANRTFLKNFRHETDSSHIINIKLKQSMITGMAIADVPATISIVYYMSSADLEKSIILVASSFILCFLFKPVLPGQ